MVGANSSELETKLTELNSQPASLLGIDKWVLRSIPEDQRKIFLKGFEKLARIVFFPDHAKSQYDRQLREQYVSRISEAVRILSDPMTYEVATSELSSAKDPTIRLKEYRELDIKKIKQLEERIATLSKELGSANSDAKNAEKLAQRILVLQQAEIYHRKNLFLYDIPQEGNFAISGRRIGFDRKRKLTGIRLALYGDELSEERRREIFEEYVQESLFDAKKERLEFRGNFSETENAKVSLLGGMPHESLREYIKAFYTDDNITPTNLLAEDLTKHIRRMNLKVRTNSDNQKDYERKVSPFLTPYVILSSPVLLKREGKTNTRFELFYVEGIVPSYLI